MSNEPEPFEFDDSEAVQFILATLSDEAKRKITDDDVQYVLDVLCEYYDKNHLMDSDGGDDEAAIAEDDMHNYIWNVIQKENVVQLTEDDLQEILDGEFEYGKRIGIYTEV
ncbi:MAG: hypothetical protein ACI392_02940 [Paludibacteraceae bacterium]